MVPSSQPKDSSQRKSCTHQGGTHGSHVRGACAQQLPMLARGVSSSSPTAQHCLTFQSTQEITFDRRDTRSHLIQPAAKLRARQKRSVLALLCGHGHDRFPQQDARGSRSEAPTQEERKKAEGAKQRRSCGAASSSKSRSSRTHWKIRKLQTCVIRVSQRQPTKKPRSSQPTKMAK